MRALIPPLLLVALITCGWSVCANAANADSVVAEELGLMFKLETDSYEYFRGDIVPVRFSVKNIRDTLQWVMFGCYMRVSHLAILDEPGEAVWGPGCYLATHWEDIPAGGYVVDEDEWDMTTNDGLASPGIYRIHAYPAIPGASGYKLNVYFEIIEFPTGLDDSGLPTRWGKVKALFR